MCPLSPARLSKFKAVSGSRQTNLTVVLENVHDPHNIGAVLRTCDSVGVNEIYVLNSDERLKGKGQFFGKASASGARKWIKIHYFEDVDDCFNSVKLKYRNLYGTLLDRNANSLYDLDLTDSVALVFGNEHDGLSDEVSKFLDGNFLIPQFGMVESLNISVACAVSLYESCRQRLIKGMYNHAPKPAILEKFISIHENQSKKK